MRAIGTQQISAVGGRVLAAELIDAGLVQDMYLTTSPITGGEPGTPMYPRPLELRTIVWKRGTLHEAGVLSEHPLLFRHDACSLGDQSRALSSLAIDSRRQPGTAGRGRLRRGETGLEPCRRPSSDRHCPLCLPLTTSVVASSSRSRTGSNRTAKRRTQSSRSRRRRWCARAGPARPKSRGARRVLAERAR
jgi:hypothetical protein